MGGNVIQQCVTTMKTFFFFFLCTLCISVDARTTFVLIKCDLPPSVNSHESAAVSEPLAGHHAKGERVGAPPPPPVPPVPPPGPPPLEESLGGEGDGGGGEGEREEGEDAEEVAQGHPAHLAAGQELPAAAAAAALGRRRPVRQRPGEGAEADLQVVPGAVHPLLAGTKF